MKTESYNTLLQLANTLDPIDMSSSPVLGESARHDMARAIRRVLEDDTMRDLDDDFYDCPNTGEKVYKWADDRYVLIDSEQAREQARLLGGIRSSWYVWQWCPKPDNEWYDYDLNTFTSEASAAPHEPSTGVPVRLVHRTTIVQQQVAWEIR